MERIIFWTNFSQIRLLFLFLILGCLGGNVTSPEASAVGGAYILTQVDGALLPTPPPAPGTAVPCPPAITDGELSLDPARIRDPQFYGISVYMTRACDPGGIPIDGVAVFHDAGAWSIQGDQINFVSSPYLRTGNYQGSVVTRSPVLTITIPFAGRMYTFSRLADQSRMSSGVTVLVVDQQGLRVGGALVVFRSSNGRVARTYSGTSGPEAMAVAPPGNETINIAPPAGYTFAPSQLNPVSATAVADQVTTITVVLAKTSP
ncbi:MAG: hypothetical protein ABI229_00280 [Gemmatimonadaceae bacterium]